MILYGWRSKFSKSGEIADSCCSFCKTGKINVLTAFRYFHIYYIPLLPYSRTKATECENCKAYVDEENIKDNTLLGKLSSIQKAKFPIWMFSGIFVIAAIIGLFIYDDNQKAAKTAAYLESPAKGDLYIVKLAEPILHNKDKLNYTVYRVSDINNENLTFDVSQWAYPTFDGLEKAINSKKEVIKEFYEDEFSISRNQIKDREKLSGEIVRVLRFH